MIQIKVITLIAVWGYLYCGKLTESSGVFYFMPNLISKIASLGKANAMTFKPKNYIQNALVMWGYKCAECHAGLVALIYSIINQHWDVDIIIFSIFLARILVLFENRYL